MAQTDREEANISLLIADVDGTLVTEDKVLTPGAREAVHKLQAAGIAFAITSGRPPRGMAMLIEALGLQTPIAGFNGGTFVQPDMTIIEEHVLAADVAWVAAIVGAKSEARITLTYPALESSRHAAFLVSGEEKRAIFSRLRRDDGNLPAARLHPTGKLCLFADAAAAGGTPS